MAQENNKAKQENIQINKGASKVYFKKIDSYSKTTEISKAAKELAELIQKEEKVLDFSKPLPLKVHFGEEGNVTFIEPKNYDGLINWLNDNTKSTNPKYPQIFFTDTNVLYKGKRTTKESHMALAKEHGFIQLPVLIADGEAGEENTEIDISSSGAKHFTKCKVGNAIAQNDQLIVLAHFKGHMLAGFGGAIKQLSMGCAARPGKLAMHSQARPVINPLKCKKCLTCVKHCPVDACIISTIPHIDKKKCVGCAMCIAVCPYGAVGANWISTLPKEFNEKLAEYALAAQKDKKVIYINFAFNITKECDCMGTKQKPVASDIGVLASTDPVALDKACMDYLREKEGKKVFSGDNVFTYAEKIGLGSMNYELVEVK